MPGVSDILGRVLTEILGPAEAVIFAAGFLLFIWGLVKFLYNVEEGSSGAQDGKRHMIWGIVGMFIMVSIWAIIGILDNTFGLGAINGNGPATDANRINQIQNITFTGQ